MLGGKYSRKKPKSFCIKLNEHLPCDPELLPPTDLLKRNKFICKKIDWSGIERGELIKKGVKEKP